MLLYGERNNESGKLPRYVADEIGSILYTYVAIDGYIAGLRRERAEVEERLLPKAGTSLVQVMGKDVRMKADPTGKAASNLADHPFIKKLDRLIAYWQERKEKVDQLLHLLTKTELKIVKFYYFEGPPDNHSDWPRLSRQELRQVRRQIIERAARLWGLWGHQATKNENYNGGVINNDSQSKAID